MSIDKLVQEASDGFERAFGQPADVARHAPGRVNLLGEHTDYNGGFVLPMPLRLGTVVAMGKGGEAGTLSAASTSFDGITTRRNDEQAIDTWTDYVMGSLHQLFGNQWPETGINVMISADLPLGSGLSSSAALEVATIRAACELFDIEKDDVEIAQMARRAENDFVGMPCGIMDQYSVSVGDPGHAIFLDTRALTSKVAPLPATHKLIIVHSGVAHKLTDDGYARRVAECAEARAALGVDSLSDLTMSDLGRIAGLPSPLDGRAKHIVTENDRVARAVKALEAGETAAFARLMVESHASQRDDYEVSVPEVDALVEGALEAGADGARLTGGGFGGSVVALVRKDLVETWCDTISSQFSKARILAVT